MDKVMICFSPSFGCIESDDLFISDCHLSLSMRDMWSYELIYKYILQNFITYEIGRSDSTVIKLNYQINYQI